MVSTAYLIEIKRNLKEIKRMHYLILALIALSIQVIFKINKIISYEIL
jgi:hypothetical protein